VTTETFTEKVTITSAMATAFLSAHMSVRAAEHLCEDARSAHEDDPDLWHNLARAEVHEAEREIESFVEASIAAGLDTAGMIGTFAADLDGLERRLDAIRYQVQTDLADRFWWGNALFDNPDHIVGLRIYWDEWGLFSSDTEAVKRAKADLNESTSRALRQEDPRDAWAIFRAACKRHADLGASDSEIEDVFRRMAMERYGEAGHGFGPNLETN
jgi:hypothetical protein